MKFMEKAEKFLSDRLLSVIFSSTACNKCSFSKDGHPLHSPLCTFFVSFIKTSHLSLYTIESLTECSA